MTVTQGHPRTHTHLISTPNTTVQPHPLQLIQSLTPVSNASCLEVFRQRPVSTKMLCSRDTFAFARGLPLRSHAACHQPPTPQEEPTTSTNSHTSQWQQQQSAPPSPLLCTMLQQNGDLERQVRAWGRETTSRTMARRCSTTYITSG